METIPLPRMTTMVLGLISLVCLALPLTGLFTTEWVRYADRNLPLAYSLANSSGSLENLTFTDLWAGPLLFKATFSIAEEGNSVELVDQMYGVVSNNHPVGAVVSSCQPYSTDPKVGGFYVQYGMDAHRCCKFQFAQGFIVLCVMAKVIASLTLLIGGIVPFIRTRVRKTAVASFIIATTLGVLGVLAFFITLQHPTKALGYSAILFIVSLPIDAFMIFITQSSLKNYSNTIGDSAVFTRKSTAEYIPSSH